MPQPKKKRIYSSEHASAIIHPLRSSLLKLIQEGVNTTPQLAEVLGENRMNLYHHLGFLERSGYIESYFEGDRVKKYRIVSTKKVTQGNIDNPIIDTKTIVLTPTKDNIHEFTQKINELLDIAMIDHDKDLEILQIQIIYQDRKAVDLRQTKVKELQQKMQGKANL